MKAIDKKSSTCACDTLATKELDFRKKGVLHMKRQVLFIHSAGAQGLHQGSSGLVANLQDALGDEHLFSDGLPELVDDIKQCRHS